MCVAKLTLKDCFSINEEPNRSPSKAYTAAITPVKQIDLCKRAGMKIYETSQIGTHHCAFLMYRPCGSNYHQLQSLTKKNGVLQPNP